MPLEPDPRGKDYRASYGRFPVGVVFGIVPYNWPYNLAAHKIAPALAVGATIVIKAAPQAALCTLTLGRLLHEAKCPAGVVNVVHCPAQAAQTALQDPRVAMVSFTGSPEVGWKLKSLVPEKCVTLELGANSAALVFGDADLDWACRRIVAGAYGYAGQVCIAVQHALVEESAYDAMRERLIEATRTCVTGDPRLRDTVCGPMIDERAARKVEEWVEEAVAQGVTVLAGGSRQGAILQPTLVEGRPAGARLSCDEVFGPVLTLERFASEEEASAKVNGSTYGIHCGVFTKDAARAQRAFQTLEVGGVVIDDSPTVRFDNLPYGGVKRSGFGREGVRFAMEEMTELRSFVRRLP